MIALLDKDAEDSLKALRKTIRLKKSFSKTRKGDKKRFELVIQEIKDNTGSGETKREMYNYFYYKTTVATDFWPDI